MPLADRVLESTSPLWEVGAVVGMSGSVVGLDQPEALARGEAKALGVGGGGSWTMGPG
jgi:hypothetical protein